jgi:homocitrate synthase NifV
MVRVNSGKGGESMRIKRKEVKPMSACHDVSGYATHVDAHPVRLGEIMIVDTTCRDGEQMPGISFTMEEKIEIARRLEHLGVEQLETFATYNDSDKACARLLKAQARTMSIMGWNRMVKSDIEDSIAHDVDAVSVSTDTSDMALEHKLRISREEQIARLVDCVSFAKDHGVYVCFNAGDATRTNVDYLIEFAKAGKEAGGDRFRICDTIGVLTPARARKLIHAVMSSVDIDVEFHAHNDFGLAVANALAACEAAAEFSGRKLWVSTTVNGLGERAGNVPIEVFVMNLHKHYALEKYRIEHILPLCKHVEKASGQGIPLNYPVVGGNMFTHKSGIHVDGVLKNPQLYEAFDPAKLGVQRTIALGKHSGKASIRHKLEQLGLTANSDAMEKMRLEVSRIGEETKRNLTDEEFISIYYSVVQSAGASGSKSMALVETTGPSARARV